MFFIARKAKLVAKGIGVTRAAKLGGPERNDVWACSRGGMISTGLLLLLSLRIEIGLVLLRLKDLFGATG